MGIYMFFLNRALMKIAFSNGYHLLFVTTAWLCFISFVMWIEGVPFILMSLPCFFLILLIRPSYFIARFFVPGHFKSVKKNDYFEIHMSLFACVKNLDKNRISFFKNGLKKAVINSFSNGATTVKMRSHLLSNVRLREIKQALSEAYPDDIFELNMVSSKVSAFESFVIKTSFLLSEWRTFKIKDKSFVVTIKKL